VSAFQVAIPSAGRADLIGTTTLPLLRRHGIDPECVTVFVPDAEQAEAYRRVLDGLRVVSGHGWGVRQARNAIARHYAPGTRLVCIDDDIRDVMTYTPDRKNLAPVPNLAAIFTRAFLTAGRHLWCVYPVANPFFMGPEVRRGKLWYACACLFGYTVQRDERTEIVVTDDKEDFERSCRFYRRDGEIVRFDMYAPVTRYYTQPGGMQTYRTAETIEAGARKVAAMFPDLATAYQRKDGRWEIRLRPGGAGRSRPKEPPKNRDRPALSSIPE
jgi:hypothetical protein